MPEEKTLLGELLQKAKLITKEQLNEALLVQKIEGKGLGAILMRLGYLNEENLVSFLSRQYHVPGIKLSNYKVDRSLLKLVPYSLARKYRLIPLAVEGESLRIAIADPSNSEAIDEVAALTGKEVFTFVAAQSVIMAAVEKYYPAREKAEVPSPLHSTREKGTFTSLTVDRVIESALDELTIIGEKAVGEIVSEDDILIVRFVDAILKNAIKSRTSDIHIDPDEDILRIRYRIDGVLHPVLRIPIRIGHALTARIKTLSDIDAAEPGLPQNGRIRLKYGKEREIDYRVSLFPTLFGEKIVLKVIDKSGLQLDLRRLGFEDKSLQDLLEALQKPTGLILVTGPTDSGKTTTLYAALSYLNKPGVNIMTVEDPVEYNFPGINQGQIKEEIGLTFPHAVRTILRQDPDIIMVGELKDSETAEIATTASLTGHLVLSTLHTNDAASCITRLTDMGLTAYLLSSTVTLVVAQRLVRKICQYCKKEQKISEAVLLKLGFPLDTIKHTKCFMETGCSKCNNTGFKGRIALHEVMPFKDELRGSILAGASATELRKEAVRLGMTTLRQAGLKKVAEGLTSIDEILRMTPED